MRYPPFIFLLRKVYPCLLVQYVRKGLSMGEEFVTVLRIGSGFIADLDPVSQTVLRSRNYLIWLRSRLRLRLELCGYLFSQLLNDKVDFSWLWKEYRLNSFFWSYSIWIMIKYTTLVWPGAGAGSRSRNFSIPAPAPAPAKSSGSLRLRLHNTALLSDQTGS